MSRNGLKLYTHMYPHKGCYHSEGIRIWILGGGAVGQNVPFLALLADLAWVTQNLSSISKFYLRIQCSGISKLRKFLRDTRGRNFD